MMKGKKTDLIKSETTMRFLGFVWRVRCDFHHEVKKHNAILCVNAMPFCVAHLII